MKERTDRISALLEKSLQGDLTSGEKEELDLWLSERTENRELYQQLTDQDQLLERLRIHELANASAMWQKTVSRIGPGAKVIEFPGKRFTWVKVAAAAVFVGAVSVAVYFFNQGPAKESVAQTEKQEASKPDEIVPGGNHAILTLADGSKIQLDKTPDGDLSNQSGLSLLKTEGHLSYSGRFITSGPVSTGSEKHASLHNMVSTPRGGQYQITLPDGSRVWLNAASSLRFPLAFAGNQRIVEVTGEAYFEVKKMSVEGSGKRMPFVVRVNNGVPQDVEVLGTKFNVKAYPEENEIRTSLLEGSVRVKEREDIKIIKPGQQAIAQDGELKIVDANIEDAIAWKDGSFPVVGTTEVLLNQIARWYNVEIVYEPNTDKTKQIIFNADIPMKMSYENMIRVLESQGIRTKIDKRKLIINQ